MNNFKTMGILLDVSRNAVMRVDSLKNFISMIADLGYNLLELYMEDTLKVENEPYLGYMRGGYTAEEIRDIDSFCSSHGVELVPAVQTLAHFTNTCKLRHYSDAFDVGDILFIGSERAYKLIDNIFAEIARDFSSKKVNIGMDEALLVGLGKYLEIHGYRDRNELLLEHLQNVADIAKKYDLELQMWSDMFFRLSNGGEYYSRTPVLDERLKSALPSNVVPVYWDYYHVDAADYDAMFKAHKKFGKETWFAGGLWTWTGFVPVNGFAMASMKVAIKSAIRNEIDNIFFTAWGDDGKECSFYAALPSIYAISRYAAGDFDDKKIREGFKNKYGISFEEYMSLDLPNGSENDKKFPTKALFYADPFLGITDKSIEKEKRLPYGEYSVKIAEAGKKAGKLSYVFDCISDFCSVLEIKARLGINVRKAYSSGSREELQNAAKDFEILLNRVDKFYCSFKTTWFKENKPFGFEIQDYRFGGLMRRLLTCKERIEKTLISGTPIEELEETVLELEGKLDDIFFKNSISTSGI